MIGEPICATCKHFIKSEKKFNKCKAFPNKSGIPGEIILGENDHSKKLPGQTGDYIYEKKE